MDDLDQAIYSTVHSSRIGAKKIAQRIGISDQVLLNKANPSNETHKLTVREALAIQLATKKKDIARAMQIAVRDRQKIK